MSGDFRVALDFLDHPKTVRLKNIVGAEGIFCLMRLWAFAGNYRPRGLLSGMKIDDIALAAKWPGDSDEFVNALLDSKFLDKIKNGVYQLHNWKIRQGYLYHKPERRQKAQKAAKAKHAKGDNELRPAQNDAKHAPLPLPLPLPTPTPTPQNTEGVPPDPVDGFVEKYREICQPRGLKKVLIVNKSRRGKIRQRLKELEGASVTVDEYMQKIANSPFLRGDRGNWAGADFDFIIGAQNIGKILDGKYDRRDSDIDWGNIGGDDEKE